MHTYSCVCCISLHETTPCFSVDCMKSDEGEEHTDNQIDSDLTFKNRKFSQTEKILKSKIDWRWIWTAVLYLVYESEVEISKVNIALKIECYSNLLDYYTSNVYIINFTLGFQCKMKKGRNESIHNHFIYIIIIIYVAEPLTPLAASFLDVIELL